jgi:penicillin V acylase-like amidase (Ntn superfamily)
MSPDALEILTRHAAALEANTEALRDHQESLDRFIRANSELTGILTRSEEKRAVTKARRELMRSVPKGIDRILAG